MATAVTHDPHRQAAVPTGVAAGGAGQERHYPRHSNSAAASVHAPAKKQGGGGCFTWGTMMDVTDYQPMATEFSKVTTLPVQVASATGPVGATKTPAPAPIQVNLDDASHFPTLLTGGSAPPTLTARTWPLTTPATRPAVKAASAPAAAADALAVPARLPRQMQEARKAALQRLKQWQPRQQHIVAYAKQHPHQNVAPAVVPLDVLRQVPSPTVMQPKYQMPAKDFYQGKTAVNVRPYLNQLSVHRGA
eukprot:TRINITY_DN3075_c0_g1_i1.p1 TRINITY_DN3075_c0_g1~~TRINITY_DN3075_c0_g1_i1.p1  ORF type:complete len:275 (-),score=52.66 TRINITY_DN3075_c0_g1_i1:69-812(-)